MRCEIFDCPIDVLTKAETVAIVREAMQVRKPMMHVALNVAKLVNMRFDPILANDVRSGDLIGIDGMGIILAARLLGINVKERVAGIDLFESVLAACATDGFRPFFLGATPEIIARAVAAVREDYPTIEFAGYRDGYFKQDQENAVVEEIRNSGADCLFIGMPTPRKERFLAAHRVNLGVSFVMGVGGSFDVIAGHVERAPAWVQDSGFEWLYRVYQEPRRMWWRYLRTNTIFAGMMIRAIGERLSTSLHNPTARTKA
jgi:N-acetylglucosaminyldiphosphoundecaprenol N-acetyl-beta-D-mannosaminyltransferase